MSATVCVTSNFVTKRQRRARMPPADVPLPTSGGTLRKISFKSRIRPDDLTFEAVFVVADPFAAAGGGGCRNKAAVVFDVVGSSSNGTAVGSGKPVGFFFFDATSGRPKPS